MASKDIISVKLSRKECFRFFRQISHELLDDKDYSFNFVKIYIEEYNEDFRLIFEGEKVTQIENSIPSTTKETLIYDKFKVIEKIIDSELKERKIKKVANLDTPFTDLIIYPGNLSIDNFKTAISFNFSLVYESANDSQ